MGVKMKKETLEKMFDIFHSIFLIVIICAIVGLIVFTIYFSNQQSKLQEQKSMICFNNKTYDGFTKQIVLVSEDKYNCCETKAVLINNTYVNEKKCWALIR
jgi:hypothetical protein